MKHYGFDPETVRFTPSRPGHNGMFIGYLQGDSERNHEIGVVNDLGYNQKQIGNIALGGPDSGVTVSSYGGRPDGAKDASGRPIIVNAYTPYRNYTANDIKDPLLILVVQIHELGHSLSWNTGVSPYTDPKSLVRRPGTSDEGTFLERCVFGGEVNRNGQVLR